MKNKICCLSLLVVLHFPLISFAQTPSDLRMGLGYSHRTMEKQLLGLEYNLGLIYDEIDDAEEADWMMRTGEQKYFDIVNSLQLSYDVTDRLSAFLNVPFLIRNRRWEQSVSTTAIGDISAGLKAKILEDAATAPQVNFLISYRMPTGKSPYKINPEKELATGTGLHFIETELTFDKAFGDWLPFLSLATAFGFAEDNLNNNRYGYRLTEVSPGLRYGGEIGVSASWTESVSGTAAIEYIRHEGDEYTYSSHTNRAEPQDFGVAEIGGGFKIMNILIFPKVGFGLTDDAPDYFFNLKIPFQSSL